MSTNIEAIERNPLAVDEKELNRMMAELDGSDPGDGDADLDAAQVRDDSDQVDGEGEASAQQQANEPDPSNATVLTRDGKHQIPYSVLEAERNRAREAQQAAEAARQLAEQEKAQRELLERQLAQLSDAADQARTEGVQKDAQAAVDEIISTEQLEAIRDEAPELAAVFDRMIGTITGLQGKLRESDERETRREQERQAEQQRRHAEMVEQAIGNNPKLVYARAQQPEMFNAIVEVDDWVRQQPKFRGLSLEERFAKSVAMYEAANGAIAIPGNASPGKQGVSSAAAAAIATEGSSAVPNTLSDLPGGGLPPKSDAEALGSLNATDLTHRMMDMDPAQIDKLLARLSM